MIRLTVIVYCQFLPKPYRKQSDVPNHITTMKANRKLKLWENIGREKNPRKVILSKPLKLFIWNEWGVIKLTYL